MNGLGGDVQELPQRFREHMGRFSAQRNTLGFKGAGREIGGVQNRVGFLKEGKRNSKLWAKGYGLLA